MDLVGRSKLHKDYPRVCLTIALLCVYASLTPLRADALLSGGVRLEFFWTQLHKLACGISKQNAEILFPTGAPRSYSYFNG